MVQLVEAHKLSVARYSCLGERTCLTALVVVGTSRAKTSIGSLFSWTAKRNAIFVALCGLSLLLHEGATRAKSERV